MMLRDVGEDLQAHRIDNIGERSHHKPEYTRRPSMKRFFDLFSLTLPLGIQLAATK